MDDDFVNFFWCGSRKCRGLRHFDVPFYRWEGPGFKDNDFARDRCVTCFEKYRRADRLDFVKYERHMSTYGSSRLSTQSRPVLHASFLCLSSLLQCADPSETSLDEQMKQQVARTTATSTFVEPARQRAVEAETQMSISMALAAAGDVVAQATLDKHKRERESSVRGLSRADDEAELWVGKFVSLNRYQILRKDIPSEPEQDDGYVTDYDGDEEGGDDDVNEALEAAAAGGQQEEEKEKGEKGGKRKLQDDDDGEQLGGKKSKV